MYDDKPINLEDKRIILSLLQWLENSIRIEVQCCVLGINPNRSILTNSFRNLCYSEPMRRPKVILDGLDSYESSRGFQDIKNILIERADTITYSIRRIDGIPLQSTVMNPYNRPKYLNIWIRLEIFLNQEMIYKRKIHNLATYGKFSGTWKLNQLSILRRTIINSLCD